MGNLGWTEILIILVIALIIFGPRKLPELGKSLGQSLAQFRRASEDFKRTWEDEVELEKRRLDAPSPPAGSAPETPAFPSEVDEYKPGGLEVNAAPPAAEDAPATAPAETAAQETKRDWM